MIKQDAPAINTIDVRIAWQFAPALRLWQTTQTLVHQKKKDKKMRVILYKQA